MTEALDGLDGASVFAELFAQRTNEGIGDIATHEGSALWVTARAMSWTRSYAASRRGVVVGDRRAAQLSQKPLGPAYYGTQSWQSSSR